jgi:hypothetical protein
MFSKLLLGVAIVLYGLANLNILSVSIRTFYYSLVVLGVVYFVEVLYTNRTYLNRANKASAPVAQPQL